MIYHVFANRSNIGDWLSAKGIQMLLGNAEVTECLCDVPYVPETIETLSRADEDDLVVIGGGGLLMEYFVPFWEAFRPLAKRLRFCIWGVGCCDLKQEATLPPGELLREIVALAQLCIVRDGISRTFLADCELPAPVPCPSINLFTAPAIRGSDILHVVNYSTAGADAYDAMCSIARQYTDDKEIVYRETNNRVSKNRVADMEKVLSLYAGADIVLSSALHGCILGLAMGAKVLAVSGDRKIEAFMEAVGLGAWVIDQKDVHLVSARLKEIHLQIYPEQALTSVRQRNEAIGLAIRALIHEHSRESLARTSGIE